LAVGSRQLEITKKFPAEEKYELTDQIRRSSRSVCRAIGEGYRKRQYPKHFSSKMSDADMENTETQVSLDFAETCEYISLHQYKELIKDSEEIGRLLNHMIENPEKYKPRHNLSKLANCQLFDNIPAQNI
jgi:four helix bundle protein